jgi:integrase
VGVRADKGKLFLDFRWRGVRCREFTQLTDTPENRRRCAAVFKIIQGEIGLGTFDYRRHFPNGAKLHVFYPTTDVAAGCTLESYLRTWHSRRSPFRSDGSIVEDAELHPSTWKHDESVVMKRLIPALGNIRVDQLTAGRCRDYRRVLQEEGLEGKTVTNILGVLHKALEDAVEEGLIAVNPVPKLSRGSRRASRVRRKNSDPLTLVRCRSSWTPSPPRTVTCTPSGSAPGGGHRRFLP